MIMENIDKDDKNKDGRDRIQRGGRKEKKEGSKWGGEWSIGT
jgi:hypothetical protein